MKGMFCIFAIVLLSFALAQDYEGGGDEEGEGEESYDGGFGGGDGEVEGEGGGEVSGFNGGDYGDAGDYAATGYNDDASALSQLFRKKRSLNTDDSKRVLSRVRRGGKGRVGPVFTFQKTDHHANFKWGVKHNVGKQYGK